MRNQIKKIALAILLGVMFGLQACSDDINVDIMLDDSVLNQTGKLNAFIKDGTTGKSENIVDLRTQEYKTTVYVGLNKVPQKGVDAQITYDAEYLKSYNAEHNTDFELFPQDLVSITNDGKLLIAPDEKQSMALNMTIRPQTEFDEDKTYVIPMKVNILTDGICLDENTSHCVYLLKCHKNESDCFKGENAIKNLCILEVNDVNPLNLLEFKLENSGKLYFDALVIFAANVNYNAAEKKVYISNNANVQFLLDNNETYLQPLRDRGMKIILGILGNHDISGPAQLSKQGAQMLAKDMAAYCYAYNLDGVMFDDEWSATPDLSNPLLAQHGWEAGMRMMYETKRAMPDKINSVYTVGFNYKKGLKVDGSIPGEFIDIIIPNYGGTSAPDEGMTLANCCAMSLQLNAITGGNSNEYWARNIAKQGYGWFMYYALEPSKYNFGVPKLKSLSRGLYEDKLVEPVYYYKKDDPTPYLFSESGYKHW